MRYILPLLLALLISQPAQAHRLNIFAQVANDMVVVTTNFGKDRPARNVPVSVRIQDTVVLSGTTDSSGSFAFPWKNLDTSQTLSITANAGEGHIANWTLEPSDFPKEGAKSDDLRSIIREEISQAILPLRQELAASTAGPSLKDILGGLGWIVGVTCLLYALQTKRRQTPRPE
ncbi:MAG: hypothetical protein IJU76_10570 [Desulfovibrionaceae bacterium]|nr:hypothetical protein [Desulfovibrionaceae bacterium]